MTTIVNYTQQKRDEDDDMSLADIMSLRISSPSPMEEKNDWAVQNELYYKQIQSSYYQLQYLQQQQMLMMMNSSQSRRSSTVSSSSSSTTTTTTTTTNTSHYRYKKSRQPPPLSPSSPSSKQQQQHYPLSPSSSNSSSSNRTSMVETPKRRQSLGKRIKKVFGMTVELPIDTASTKMSTNTNAMTSAGAKSPVILSMPNSPNSSISSIKPRHRRRYNDINQLPSPASSTVSTTSFNTNNTNNTNNSLSSSSSNNKKKKSVSFNSVIKLHETFSASDYDRKCDTSATCQKLTPVLALKIKEELNNYKLNEMFVHLDSRQNTHFFM
ncbi:hypothetical protein HPULCUR_002672 [Helicostylum pulchrum]|uniref:Uncharacterized protein n=1 Tax=Helicostylum pulchrum TaxID=562976 RepID=A0ABP9XRE3_9FUNG